MLKYSDTNLNVGSLHLGEDDSTGTDGCAQQARGQLHGDEAMRAGQTQGGDTGPGGTGARARSLSCRRAWHMGAA